MERSEAEAIYDAGRDAVVEVLLELSAQNERLAGQVEVLSARVAGQDERIAQLEGRLRRSSQNSSKPPSADPPSAPPRRGKDSSARSQGAQSAHEGHGRALLPAWAVDEVIEHWPDHCECGRAFTAQERVAVSEPVRWQVEELGVISVRVSEHQCQRVRWHGCGERTRGELPRVLAASAFGPRFQAAVATLSVRNRISRRDVVELCEQLFSARISAGTVAPTLHRAADALTEPHDDLLGGLRASATVNMDETGWRTAGERRALWGIFDERHAYLHVASERHEDHAKELLGDTEGQYAQVYTFTNGLVIRWKAYLQQSDALAAVGLA